LAEEELVDNYVQDRLSISERKAFEESFLATPDGRRQVMLTKALRVHASRRAAGQIVAHTRPRKTSSRWGFSFTPLRAAAVAASVLLVASVGVWRGIFHESDTAKGRSALAEAYRNQRPFEGRITGWPYAPFSSTRG